MLRILPVIATATILCSCAEPIKTTVLRLNGDKVAGNPVLEHAYMADHAVCTGERQKANLSGTVAYGSNVPLAGLVAPYERSMAADDVMRGCLAQKGYVIVREDQADAKSAQFKAVAAQSSVTTASTR